MIVLVSSMSLMLSVASVEAVKDSDGGSTLRPGNDCSFYVFVFKKCNHLADASLDELASICSELVVAIWHFLTLFDCRINLLYPLKMAISVSFIGATKSIMHGVRTF